MPKYEYTVLVTSQTLLNELNNLASAGWEIVSVFPKTEWDEVRRGQVAYANVINVIIAKRERALGVEDIGVATGSSDEKVIV